MKKMTVKFYQNACLMFLILCSYGHLSQAAQTGILNIKEVGISNYAFSVKVANGNDSLTLMAGDDLNFANAVNYGDSFDVKIIEQDSRQRCMVVNGQGVMSATTQPLILACKNRNLISAGLYVACAINESAGIDCFGSDNYLKTEDVPAGSYQEVAVGAQHACALKTDNSVVCWGRNSEGQTDAPTVGHFISVVASHHGSCALDDNHLLQCWGNITNTPYPVPSGNFWDVDISYFHGCAIEDDLTTVCWGSDSKGRATVPSGLKAFDVAVSDYFSCAINKDNRESQCWGKNQFGEGNPITWDMADLDLGYFHGCGLSSGGGTVLCWGLGDGYEPYLTGSFTQISAGYFFTCGIREDYSVACTGDANPLE